MSATSLSEKDDAEIVVRYRRGASVGQLADRFGVSKSSIRRALARKQEPRRPAGHNLTDRRLDVDDAAITKLREAGAGHTWAEIATIVGVKPETAKARYHRARRRVGAAEAS